MALLGRRHQNINTKSLKILPDTKNIGRRSEVFIPFLAICVNRLRSSREPIFNPKAVLEIASALNVPMYLL